MSHKMDEGVSLIIARVFCIVFCFLQAWFRHKAFKKNNDQIHKDIRNMSFVLGVFVAVVSVLELIEL